MIKKYDKISTFALGIPVRIVEGPRRRLSPIGDTEWRTSDILNVIDLDHRLKRFLWKSRKSIKVGDISITDLASTSIHELGMPWEFEKTLGRLLRNSIISYNETLNADSKAPAPGFPLGDSKVRFLKDEFGGTKCNILGLHYIVGFDLLREGFLPIKVEGAILRQSGVESVPGTISLTAHFYWEWDHKVEGSGLWEAGFIKQM